MNKKIEDNQLFYGALKALSLLPNSMGVVREKCEQNEKTFPDEIFFDNKIDDDILTSFETTKYSIFFDALYGYLKNGGAPNDPVFDTTADGMLPIEPTYDGQHNYISLSLTIGWSNSDHQRCPEQRPRIRNNFFTPAVEYAVNKSGISRELVSKNVRVDLYDNGTIIAKNSEVVNGYHYTSIPYPNSAALKVRYMNFERHHFEHCPQMSVVQYFRLVDIKGEQSFKSAYLTVSGEIIEKNMDYLANAKEKVAVVTVADLKEGGVLSDVSDEDILNLNGDVETNYISRGGEDYRVGYSDKWIQAIENTDVQGLYKQTNIPIYVMTLEEPIQIGIGGSYRLLDRGDMVTFRVNVENDSPAIIRKSTLDKGIYELVLLKARGSKRNNKIVPRLN